MSIFKGRFRVETIGRYKFEVSGNLGLNWMPGQPGWLEYAFPKSPWQKDHWQASAPIIVQAAQSVLTINPVAATIPYRLEVYGHTTYTLP